MVFYVKYLAIRLDSEVVSGQIFAGLVDNWVPDSKKWAGYLVHPYSIWPELFNFFLSFITNLERI